jgi:hypothetical protein
LAARPLAKISSSLWPRYCYLHFNVRCWFWFHSMLTSKNRRPSCVGCHMGMGQNPIPL